MAAHIMEIEAAVVREESGPFEIESVELDDPQSGDRRASEIWTGEGITFQEWAVEDEL